MSNREKESLLRYFLPGRSVPAYVTLVLVLFASFLAAHYSISDYRSYLVEFVVETDEPVLFDIYYDVGRGYNEVDHQSMQVEEVGVPTTVSFCIPVWTELEKLRFDPAKKHVKMALYSIRIDYDENTSFQVPLETLDPQKDILRHAFDGSVYTFETDPEGEDPIFVLNKIRETPPVSTWKEPSGYILWLAAGLGLFFLGSFIHRYFLLGL